MLTEKTLYQIETTETDFVQVRARTYIYRDDVEISHANSRHVVSPTQDYSGEIGKVRRMCDATFVPTVKDKHIAKETLRAAEDALSKEPDKRELKDAEKDARKAFKDAEKAHDDFVLDEK